MKKNLLAVIFVVILLLLSYLFLADQDNGEKWKTYTNQKHQFILEYPGYLTPQEFSEGSRDTITFLTKLPDGSFSPENGGMSIIIEPTNISSGEEWFSKNEEKDAPIGTLMLDKKITVASQPAVVVRYAEKSGEDLSPTPEQKTVFTRKGKLFIINGIMDFERVWSSFKFLE